MDLLLYLQLFTVCILVYLYFHLLKEHLINFTLCLSVLSSLRAEPSCWCSGILALDGEYVIWTLLGWMEGSKGVYITSDKLLSPFSTNLLWSTNKHHYSSKSRLECHINFIWNLVCLTINYWMRFLTTVVVGLTFYKLWVLGAAL